jgi:hypothetical protein
MKRRSYMRSFTLSRVGDCPYENDINTIDQEDLALSISCSEKYALKDKSIKGHLVEKQIRECCGNVEKLTSSTNWESSKNIFDSAKNGIKEIDPDKKYASLHAKFNDFYKIFERRYNNHLMTKKAIEAKENICIEIESLLTETDLASAKNKFEKTVEKWNSAEGVPDRFEEILCKKYKNLCCTFSDRIKSMKNAANCDATVEQMMLKCCVNVEQLIDESDFKKASSKLKAVESEWENISSQTTKFESLSERFKSALKLFDSKKRKYIDELEFQKKNIEKRASEMILALEAECSVKNPKSVLYKVKDLQKEWDLLEKGIVGHESFKHFTRLLKKYFSNLKFVQQKEDWERWENYTNKLLLCEKAEKLLKVPASFKVAAEIKSIWNEWRSAGHAPREKNDEIWARFNATRQKIKSGCNDFFSNLKESRGENTVKKRQLCNKAEELSVSIDWEFTAEALKELQNDWKKIGPADKTIDDELYKSFRNACNTFFERRIEFYRKLHHKQIINKSEKKTLIVEAETLNELYWKDAIKKIKKLRLNWKNIGAANRHDEQKLWFRFNTAIDKYLAELDSSRPENLKRKDKVCEKLSILVNSMTDGHDNLGELDGQIDLLTSEWRSIGPVPREDENLIKNKYNGLLEKIENVYQKLLETKAVSKMYNKKQKEDVLALIESLADDEAFEKNNMKYKSICDEWRKLSCNIGDSAGENLNVRFNEICKAFENENWDYFVELKKEKAANLKNKIKICVELEKLVDISTSTDFLANDNSGSLADELMFAIKGNFATDKKAQNRETAYAKFKKLQKTWSGIGVVPIEEFENINMRYSKICSTIEVKIK